MLLKAPDTVPDRARASGGTTGPLPLAKAQLFQAGYSNSGGSEAA